MHPDLNDIRVSDWNEPNVKFVHVQYRKGTGKARVLLAQDTRLDAAPSLLKTENAEAAVVEKGRLAARYEWSTEQRRFVQTLFERRDPEVQ